MDRYVVIGNPINHSKSPFIHTLFARQTGQQMTYDLLESPLDCFAKTANQFFAEGGKGCNITLPFKQQAYQFASQLTERARLAGAVNTLKKMDDGTILGDNTDGEGLLQDLLQHHIAVKGARILLLGAGGAARGVIMPLLSLQPAKLVIANRTKAKAEQLACYFMEYGVITAVTPEEIVESFDLIINATSASLNGKLSPLATRAISKDTVVYDMMYSSKVTCFNQWAMNNGATQVIDGLGMLVAQAAESFAIWRGIHPSGTQVLKELRHELNSNIGMF